MCVWVGGGGYVRERGKGESCKPCHCSRCAICVHVVSIVCIAPSNYVDFERSCHSRCCICDFSLALHPRYPYIASGQVAGRSPEGAVGNCCDLNRLVVHGREIEKVTEGQRGERRERETDGERDGERGERER